MFSKGYCELLEVCKWLADWLKHYSIESWTQAQKVVWVFGLAIVGLGSSIVGTCFVPLWQGQGFYQWV
jgi:hypothetical protein